MGNPESSTLPPDPDPDPDTGAPGSRAMRLPRLIAAIGLRLPQFPHSVALAVGLNLALRPRLAADTLEMLRGRPIGIRVEDAGIYFRVRLGERGFIPLFGDVKPDVVFTACAFDFYRMARRLEDPDTLFFNRRLKIEGDTELGLVVKNALDAVDWLALPGPLRAVFERASGALSGLRGTRKGPPR
jgi:predicted lipid carrier protein YhbT